jgi:hypothetical protein
MAMVVVSVVGLPDAGAAPGPATFTVQGSVEQLSVSHAVPGASVTLKGPGGATKGTGVVDSQGSFLFRDIPPATGYSVKQNDHGTVT